MIPCFYPILFQDTIPGVRFNGIVGGVLPPNPLSNILFEILMPLGTGAMSLNFSEHHPSANIKRHTAVYRDLSIYINTSLVKMGGDR